MKKTNVLIVEDEVLIARSIQTMLVTNGYNCMGMAINFEQAQELLSKKQIDLVLLDIQLSGKKTGIDVAVLCRERFKVPFVYLTSFSDEKTLIALKKTKPLAYLTKPVSKPSLITTLELALENNTKQHNEKFKLSIGKVDYFIDLASLLYIQAEHIYIKIVIQGEVLIVRSSLKKIINLLPEGVLSQINRSTAVNLKQISQIENKIIIVGKRTFAITPKFFKQFSQDLDAVE